MLPRFVRNCFTLDNPAETTKLTEPNILVESRMLSHSSKLAFTRGRLTHSHDTQDSSI